MSAILQWRGGLHGIPCSPELFAFKKNDFDTGRTDEHLRFGRMFFNLESCTYPVQK